jgi:manganese transport protein
MIFLFFQNIFKFPFMNIRLKTTGAISGKSLPEVFSSVEIPYGAGFWRRMLAFFGPAYMVSVGYMDPGNWATDIAGGSQFGYKLLWVLLMSNIMALLLQSLSARLGIVRGLDLAQASKESYPPFVNIGLYFLAEIAIAACDLAEVLGMAIGLQLLFGIPLIWGVCLTFLDTILLLFLINKGMRLMEAFILALVAVIGIAFLIEVFIAKPQISEMMTGFLPSIPDSSALYIAIGIIGATVMPHNLYLHSSLVQSRMFGKSEKNIREAIKFNLFDSMIALNLAFFVNSAILILAASTFYKIGMFEVSEIKDAHRFLEPLLGSKLAPALFAVALIASGQSSTLTGTLAGQIVMEGYLNIRIQPWIRRMITRLMAIIPAVLIISLMGEQYTGKLLVLSQVILSLQLGFAVIPLIHFVSDKQKMRTFAIRKFIQVCAWIIAGVIVFLNGRLVVQEISGWLGSSGTPWVIWLTVVPVSAGIGMLLVFITFRPFMRKLLVKTIRSPHNAPELGDIAVKTTYSRIAIAIDFSKVDTEVIRHALSISKPGGTILIIHIVETAGAIILGSDIDDLETHLDKKLLVNYQSYIQKQGYETYIKLGFGNAKNSIPKLVNEFKADLLVMGAHGHTILKDLIFGTTVDKVRHMVNIPVFIVKSMK